MYRLRNFFAALVFVTALLACGEKDMLPPADQTYQTRGLIDTLELSPDGEIAIHHEPIPEFVNVNGEKVGMNSMIMDFVVASGVSMQSLKVGDPVEFTFEIRWKTKPNILITKLSPLPAGTPINLGKAGGG